MDIEPEELGAMRGGIHSLLDFPLDEIRLRKWPDLTSRRYRSRMQLIDRRLAVERRRPPAGLIHNSDRGSQYASGAFQKLLAAHGLICSMSGDADVYDNVVMESYFGTLIKYECRLRNVALGGRKAWRPSRR